jgi:hypothetical protein
MVLGVENMILYVYVYTLLPYKMEALFQLNFPFTVVTLNFFSSSPDWVRGYGSYCCLYVFIHFSFNWYLIYFVVSYIYMYL